jgi:hypothetical protein
VRAIPEQVKNCLTALAAFATNTVAVVSASRTGARLDRNFVFSELARGDQPRRDERAAHADVVDVVVRVRDVEEGKDARHEAEAHDGADVRLVAAQRGRWSTVNAFGARTWAADGVWM